MLTAQLYFLIMNKQWHYEVAQSVMSLIFFLYSIVYNKSKI